MANAHSRTSSPLWLTISAHIKISSRMRCRVDDKIIEAIQAIIRRGNDVEIRRKGNGYVVLEVKKTIKYTTSA